MIRTLLLTGALLTAGTSAAQGATAPEAVGLAVGTDGTAAVLTRPVGLGALAGPIDLRVRRPGGPLSAPQRVTQLGSGVAAVLPGGAARVTWIAPVFDAAQVDPVGQQTLMSVVRGTDGTLGPVQSVPVGEGSVQIAAAPDGAVVAVWTGGTATAAGAEPLAVGPAPGVIPRALAVADGGRALVVGDRCDASGCRAATVDRAPGNAFEPPQPLPGATGAALVSAALAASGAAIVAGSESATLWHRGPGAATFGPGSALDMGSEQVGVAADGRGIVEDHTFGDSRRRRVAADGTLGPIERSDRVFELLDVGDDGSLLAADQHGVLTGTVDGPPAPVPGTDGVVAIAGGPRPALLLRRAGGIRAALTLVAADGRELVGEGLEPGAARYRFARLQVAPGPLRVLRGRLRVPVRCSGGGSCRLGAVRVAGRRVPVELPPDGVRTLAVPVTGNARRVALRVITPRAERTVHRRVTRRPDRRTCPVSPWSRREASAGGLRLIAEPTLSDDERSAVDVYRLCTPRGLKHVYTETDEDLAFRSEVTAVGVGGGRAAVLVLSSDHYDSWLTVVIADAATGRRRGFGVASAEVGPEVVRLLPTRSGALAVISRLADGRDRVLLRDAAGSRIADAGPGVHPASLRVEGDTVRWTTQGAGREATVTGAATG